MNDADYFINEIVDFLFIFNSFEKLWMLEDPKIRYSSFTGFHAV